MNQGRHPFHESTPEDHRIFQIFWKYNFLGYMPGTDSADHEDYSKAYRKHWCDTFISIK